MQNLYPVFEGNRVLKKEALWSLRDYSFSRIQLEYQEYGQGVVMGCKIRVEGEHLIVGTGIIKYGSFVCLLMEETSVHAEPSDQIQYLKIKVEIDRSSLDFVAYQIEIFLDTFEEKKENEFELCRFYLSCGARLRDDYKNFFDIQTEYDTINRIHGDWAAIGGSTLDPEITRCFARELLAGESGLPEDHAFACLCLSQPGGLPFEVITSYVTYRLNHISDFNTIVLGNQELYGFMCTILDGVQKGVEKNARRTRERHRILVD